MLTIALGLVLALPSLAEAGTFVKYRGSYVIPDGKYAMWISGAGAGKTKLGHHHRGTFALSAKRLERLRTALRLSAFAGLQRRYRYTGSGQPPVGAGPEFVTYRGRTVRVDPGARIPVRLGNLLERLQDIWEREKPV
ncbi:MAG: hypothetical protein QOF17_1012 [Solirubrobacteraceae bacterium]|jgi:hypothetical protein|nr:hypothetical protein [Solirubrobacteraceae bacterium]